MWLRVPAAPTRPANTPAWMPTPLDPVPRGECSTARDGPPSGRAHGRARRARSPRCCGRWFRRARLRRTRVGKRPSSSAPSPPRPDRQARSAGRSRRECPGLKYAPKKAPTGPRLGSESRTRAPPLPAVPSRRNRTLAFRARRRAAPERERCFVLAADPHATCSNGWLPAPAAAPQRPAAATSKSARRGRIVWTYYRSRSEGCEMAATRTVQGDDGIACACNECRLMTSPGGSSSSGAGRKPLSRYSSRFMSVNDRTLPSANRMLHVPPWTGAKPR